MKVSIVALKVEAGHLAALFASGLCSGAIGIVGKMAKSEDAGSLQPAQLTLFRFVLTAIVVVLIHRVSLTEAKRGNRTTLLLRGIAGVLSAYFLLAAVMHRSDVQVAVATLLNSTYIVFAPLFAWCFLKSRPERRSWLAVLLTLVGVGVLFYDHYDGGEILPSAEIWALLSGVLAGAAVVFVKQLRSGPNAEKPETIVLYYSLVAIAVSFALCVAREEWHQPTWNGWGLIVVLGALSYGAQWLMAFGLRMKDTVLGVLMFNSQIVIVAIVGVLEFDEQYSWPVIVASALITAVGIWLSLPRKESGPVPEPFQPAIR